MGLVREVVFAALFGAGHSTDAFNAAFRIPNLLRDMFAETALSAAFVPVLTSEKKKGKEAQNLLASNIFNTLFVVVGLVTVLGIVFSRPLAKIIAFGFGNVAGKLSLTGSLTSITFPFLLFVALAAWAMSYLNTEGSFFLSLPWRRPFSTSFRSLSPWAYSAGTRLGEAIPSMGRPSGSLWAA